MEFADEQRLTENMDLKKDTIKLSSSEHVSHTTFIVQGKRPLHTSPAHRIATRYSFVKPKCTKCLKHEAEHMKAPLSDSSNAHFQYLK